MIEPTKPVLAEPGQETCKGRGCPYLPVPGDTRCALHGGKVLLIAEREKKKSLYDLDKTEYLKQLQVSMNDIEANPRSQSLVDEIGILRVTLQRILSQVDADATLFLRSGEIQTLIKTIESLSKTHLAIAKEVGDLMSKEDAKKLADALMQTLVSALRAFERTEQERNDAIRSVLRDTEYLSDVEEFLVPVEKQSILEEVADGFQKVIRSSGSKGV
jgi:protein tyrosine phosphatase (PTP) superfamily phosphohydrolase (DUF442 family)